MNDKNSLNNTSFPVQNEVLSESERNNRIINQQDSSSYSTTYGSVAKVQPMRTATSTSANLNASNNYLVDATLHSNNFDANNLSTPNSNLRPLIPTSSFDVTNRISDVMNRDGNSSNSSVPMFYLNLPSLGNHLSFLPMQDLSSYLRPTSCGLTIYPVQLAGSSNVRYFVPPNIGLTYGSPLNAAWLNNTVPLDNMLTANRHAMPFQIQNQRAIDSNNRVNDSYLNCSFTDKSGFQGDIMSTDSSASVTAIKEVNDARAKYDKIPSTSTALLDFDNYNTNANTSSSYLNCQNVQTKAIEDRDDELCYVAVEDDQEMPQLIAECSHQSDTSVAFDCVICGQVISRDDSKTHIHKHLDYLPFTCNTCFKSFADEELFMSHAAVTGHSFDCFQKVSNRNLNRLCVLLKLLCRNRNDTKVLDEIRCNISKAKCDNLLPSTYRLIYELETALNALDNQFLCVKRENFIDDFDFKVVTDEHSKPLVSALQIGQFDSDSVDSECAIGVIQSNKKKRRRRSRWTVAKRKTLPDKKIRRNVKQISTKVRMRSLAKKVVCTGSNLNSNALQASVRCMPRRTGIVSNQNVQKFEQCVSDDTQTSSVGNIFENSLKSQNDVIKIKKPINNIVKKDHNLKYKRTFNCKLQECQQNFLKYGKFRRNHMDNHVWEHLQEKYRGVSAFLCINSNCMKQFQTPMKLLKHFSNSGHGCPETRDKLNQIKLVNVNYYIALWKECFPQHQPPTWTIANLPLKPKETQSDIQNNIYACSLCGFKLKPIINSQNVNGQLADHVWECLADFGDGNKFQCSMCSDEKKTIDQLRMHITTEHKRKRNADYYFNCKEHKEKFRSRWKHCFPLLNLPDSMNEKEISNERKRVQATPIQEIKENCKRPSRNSKQKSTETGTKCKICKFIVFPINMEQHVLSNHLKIDCIPHCFQCLICKRKFDASEDEIVTHLKYYHHKMDYSTHMLPVCFEDLSKFIMYWQQCGFDRSSLPSWIKSQSFATLCELFDDIHIRNSMSIISGHSEISEDARCLTVVLKSNDNNTEKIQSKLTKQCVLCDKSITESAISLNQHTWAHVMKNTNKFLYSCNLCGFKCNVMGSIHLHLRRNHPEIPNGKRIVNFFNNNKDQHRLQFKHMYNRCFPASKRYSVDTSLKKFPKPSCQNVNKRNDKLNLKTKTHNHAANRIMFREGDKCGQCGYVPTNFLSMRDHIWRELHKQENIRAFACLQCGKKFVAYCNLRCHYFASHSASIDDVEPYNYFADQYAFLFDRMLKKCFAQRKLSTNLVVDTSTSQENKDSTSSESDSDLPLFEAIKKLPACNNPPSEEIEIVDHCDSSCIPVSSRSFLNVEETVACLLCTATLSKSNVMMLQAHAASHFLCKFIRLHCKLCSFSCVGEEFMKWHATEKHNEIDSTAEDDDTDCCVILDNRNYSQQHMQYFVSTCFYAEETSDDADRSLRSNFEDLPSSSALDRVALQQLLDSALNVKCAVCKRDVSTEEAVLCDHVFDHMESSLFLCAVCKYPCETTTAIRLHFSQNHPDEAVNFNVNACNRDSGIDFNEMRLFCFPNSKILY